MFNSWTRGEKIFWLVMLISFVLFAFNSDPYYNRGPTYSSVCDTANPGKCVDVLDD